MGKYLPKRPRETNLEKHVRCWVNSYVKDCGYQNWQGVMKDLFYGGCESGIVNHLIYNGDCLKFAQKYLEDICNAIADYVEDYEKGYKTLCHVLFCRYVGCTPIRISAQRHIGLVSLNDSFKQIALLNLENRSEREWVN